jgi:8-oxo-dGTP diphosphatase
MPITEADGPARPIPVSLQGARLLHRSAGAPGDAAALAALAGDWEVARTTARIPHPFTEEMASELIAAMAEAAATGREHMFAVERLADRRLVGAAGFLFRDGVPGIGYWTGRPFWGRGHATEAVKRLVRLLFEAFAADRVFAETLPGNPASARVLDKAGFHRAGERIGDMGRTEGEHMVCHELDRDHWQAGWRHRPTVLVAAVALVDADGRVLMARRPEGRPMPDLWEFPGGKVADGERPEDTVIRELAEELGIDVTGSCLAPIAFASHAYDDFHLLMPLFVCRVWKGTPAAREGQALTWVRPNRMGELAMPPADVPLVAMLRDLL